MTFAANSRLGLPQYTEVQRCNNQEGAMPRRSSLGLGTKPNLRENAVGQNEERIPWVLSKVKIKQHHILPKKYHQEEKRCKSSMDQWLFQQLWKEK